MTRSIWMSLAVVAALAAPLAGCREEGPAERAGRKVDEAIDKLRHGDEGALEKAGRSIDEAVEDAKEEVHELRENAADAIEGEDER